ncbi:hypothetical protein P7K49_030748 [Saguinus oedipus]|uniref:Uncharacterized protein n=1 Tax=Saguinus oedipus TaxID=9490 RepID=A0ABQ9U3X5_SAGOE|nr:hypothetical protein P7K49_030748 [Saguinus oedipus]
MSQGGSSALSLEYPPNESPKSQRSWDLGLSMAEEPESAATVAFTLLDLLSPNTHHDCGDVATPGGASEQLTSGAGAASCQAVAQEPPGSNALGSHNSSAPFRGLAPPSRGPAPILQ